MGRILKILVYLCLCAGVRCVLRTPSLLCKFSDQESFLDKDGQPDVKVVHREVFLKFGRKGEKLLNPSAVTFLITGSHLDLRQYFDDAKAEQLACELHRYNTNGSHVHWPVQDTQGYNHWFSCTVRENGGRFTITSILRQGSDQPALGRHDYHSWPEIKDGDVLTVSVAMIMKTESPDVKAHLGSPQKLHCQFFFDHKPTNFTVEWKSNCEGVRKRLFSYNSLRGTQGDGVELSALAGGDASYNIAPMKKGGEGTFVCSVSVNPVEASLEISWTIEESPRVSINVESTLSLQEGEGQKVVCTADRYYPLDVDIVWYQQDPATVGQRVSAPLPKVLSNLLLSSHRHNKDRTYTLSAFFYLQASLRDSGSQFTCNVSLQSLRIPIKKSFILTVEAPFSWMFVLFVGFVLLTLSFGLFVMMRYLYSAKMRSTEKKPY